MTKTRSLIVVAGAGAALVWWATRRTPIATVTTSETFDLSPYGGPTSYGAPLVNVANAIARQEGFYVAGSIPQRANNPGDLKVPGQPTLPGTSITKFESADQGWAALRRQLWLIVQNQSAYYTPDMSIAEMARVWTATEQDAWARNVASYLGVPTSTPLWDVLL